MSKWAVPVSCTITHFLSIEVEADSEEGAELAALEAAGDHNFLAGACGEAAYHLEGSPAQIAAAAEAEILSARLPMDHHPNA